MIRLVWLLLILPLVACSPSRPGSSDDDDSGADDDDFFPDDDDLSPDDDDSTDVAPDVIITEVIPEPYDEDVFADGLFFVRFDRLPDSVEIELTQAGAPVELSVGWGSGPVAEWEAVSGLEADTAYELTVRWEPNSAGDLEYDFRTSEAGLPLPNPDALIDRVFSTDLTSGNFVEPPGIGAIIQSMLADATLLCDIDAASNLSPFSQPGLHFLSGLGTLDGPDIVPEPCSEISWMTAGSDQQLGTSDDRPGIFDNPSFELGPTDMTMPMQGLSVTINDMVMTGVYSTDGQSIVGGTLQGRIDTRPLAPALDPEGGEDAICQLVEETIGVSCSECGSPNPGAFCLGISVTELVSTWRPNIDLELTTCVDILNDFGCQDEWDQYDDNGDGTYAGCPGF